MAHARAGAEGGHAEHGRRRGGPARERDRRSEPGHLRREQDALLPQGRRARTSGRRCRSAVRGWCGPAATSPWSLSRASSRSRSRPPTSCAADGIEVEVIDPRTLVPLDLETIVAVGEKDAPARRRARGGRARGIRRRDRRRRCRRLRSTSSTRRSVRVGAPFAPVPFSPPLEDAYLPGRGDVAAAVRAMLGR